MKYVICTLFGYLCGGINPSYLIGKLRGFDIRKRGSGNAGASNAVLLLGKRAGVFAAVFDILKTYFAIRLMRHLFPQSLLVRELTGVATLLGHVFPVYMRFHGGKGLSCHGGIVLEYNPLVFLCMLSCAVPLVLITGYICTVPIVASIAFPIIYGVLGGSVWGILLFALVAVTVTCKHLENVKRIFSGTEARISFLWNREAEIARLRENGASEKNADQD